MAARTGSAAAPVSTPLSTGFSWSAAARRLDVDAVKGEQALGPESDRHREAWTAYDEVAEVSSLVSGSAALLSQCQLYAGTVDASGVERRLRDENGAPIEGFSEQLVADAEATLARFRDQAGSQRGLLLSLSENFDVTGDAYLVGWPVDKEGRPWEGDERRAASERWEVVSRGALGKSAGQWTLQLGGERAVKLPRSTTIVYRLWRKHPRRPDDSRGWVSSSLDVVRDLRVFTLAQRSAARSSIPASILVTAQEASPKNLTAPGAPAGGTIPPSAQAGQLLGVQGAAGVGPGTPPRAPMTWAQTLERLIGDAVMEVLRDAQSGRAVVPAVLAVAEKYVGSFEKIDLHRTIDSALSTLVEQARTRLAESADCPPEMLRGLGETNRWNGAQIADDEFRRYFRPKAMTIADAWTVELLWAGLLALGHPLDEVTRIRVLVDARGVVAEPDRSKLATEGLRLGAISWAAWREACGFSEQDAPTDDERAQLLAWLRPSRAESELPAGEVNRQVGAAAFVELDTTTETVELEPPRLLRAAELPTLRSLTTRTAASIVTELDADELAEQLLLIEQSARSRLEEACEAAFDQSLARGGAKLKTWARRDPELRQLLTQVDARDVHATLGPERARRVLASQFADDGDHREELFAAALAALLLSFDRIGRGVFERVARLLQLVIVRDGDPVPESARGVITAAEVERNLAAGAEVLRRSMLDLAQREVFDPVTGPQLGELTDLRVPTPVVRRTLAATGGESVEPGLTADAQSADGLVFGPTLAKYQPARLAWRWVYGPEVRARPWEPHLAVDGRTFSGPSDPGLSGLRPGGGQGFPGDHGGCRCDWVPVFADESKP